MIHGWVLILNRFAQRAAERAELAAAAVVIAIVLMLVLPLPIWLLDILIAVNLCVAGLMVVVAMYLPGPTAFSTFPAVLLLTTLFRLALEVSTARQILLEADAGHIVETFGNFVVGGNLVVGLVVFLILTVVQFIVITKGSERVSEVAARFTLDAMPGKQMSIDSDLRANLLSADEARAKRAELANESQLHGAMDGAMKFVKGDAIAGIFIVCVNLVGGIAIGVIQRGMTAGEAVQLYSVLSIGDALIAQIPALLISLTAGMITTRVVGEQEEGETTNIGQDIVRELFGEPKALLTASVIMLVFACIPGMPVAVFLTLAAMLVVAGLVGVLRPAAEAAQATTQAAHDSGRVSDVLSFTATRPFMVRLPAAIEGSPRAEAITDAMRIMRNEVLLQQGIPDLPMIDFVYAVDLSPDRIEFLMAEVPLVAASIRSGWGATAESVGRLEELGFTALEDGVSGSRKRRVWVDLSAGAELQAAGVAAEPWERVFAADVRTELMRNCQMFLGVQEMSRFTYWAEKRIPVFARELGKLVTTPRMAEVLQRLAREGVSLRNVRLILEALLDWVPREKDSDIVADQVRLALKRQLCHEVARDGLIEVVLLSPELEDQVRAAMRQTSQGLYLDLDPELEQQTLDRLGELVGTAGIRTPVLVTAADIRRAVRRLIEEEFFAVPVYAFSELTQHAHIQPVGMLEC
ncbi:type III secretion system export apparatus subunit SctV [Massilia sp. CFBP9012]|uniref:type III secretion system export apparatus subunit SctV n=1 Tax=Massilia sp. CFBP9012 TaxID=3096531 RepID=UPI002A6B3285|nr:type III secretion system export apparatus subunit SctV [Massilia sp. CFBP9012]MDY0977293.1 type III secretion system export apparatus subunit SctV [Massilia sp. CFBP9012]